MDRRSFLKTAPLAAAAVALPATMAVAHELPIDKVNRIARELSEALNEYADGSMHAEIYPSSKDRFPVRFRVSYFDIDPAVVLKNQIAATKEAMGKAYPGRSIYSYASTQEATADCTVVVMTMDEVQP